MAHVFISHFTPEQKIAEHIQKYLQEVFGQDLRVFRSSDEESIPTGAPKYEAIITALNDAQVFIVLLSEISASRPWVCFETGYAVSKGKAPILWLVRGTTPGQLPSPFVEMEARSMSRLETDNLVELIKRTTGLSPSFVPPEGMLERVKMAEAEVPQVRFDLRLILDGGTLRFCLNYEGYTEVELVAVTVGIPYDAIQRGSWIARAGNNSFIQERGIGSGRQPDYLYRTYSNSTNRLPRDADFPPLRTFVYSPKDEVDLSLLRFPLKTDEIHSHPEWNILWEVETRRGRIQGIPVPIASVLQRNA